MAECVTKAVIGQGHLNPLSLNALPVHWNFDYALRLYPLPNLIVIGDKAEPYQAKYQDCHVINPVRFIYLKLEYNKILILIFFRDHSVIMVFSLNHTFLWRRG